MQHSTTLKYYCFNAYAFSDYNDRVCYCNRFTVTFAALSAFTFYCSSNTHALKTM